jgi:hypothetical protein
MRFIGKYIHVLLSVFIMFVTLQLSRIAIPSSLQASTVASAAIHELVPGRSASAASYSESTRTWTLSAKVLQIKEVSIYGRPGSIAQIEYMNDGKPKQAWVAVRMDDYSFSNSTSAIREGDRVTLQVSGPYVSARGVDWTACPGTDLYCQNASFIEGGFPVSEDFGGLTISPSNMLIHRGNVPTGDWVNGILAWKIRPITSRRSGDVQSRDR